MSWVKITLLAAFVAVAAATLPAVPITEALFDTPQPRTMPQPRTREVKPESCGIRTVNPDARIVGGDEAIPHSYPWAAFLNMNYGMMSCGGSIIHKNWILTAGHCLNHVTQARVLVSAHDRTSDKDEEPEHKWYEASQFYIHEHYNRTGLKNDVGLVYIPEGIEFTPYVQPVCLPAKDAPDMADGELVTVLGWGSTTDAAIMSRVLREITLPVIESERCAILGDDEEHTVITDDVMCLDTTGGEGACYGDSGGAVVTPAKEHGDGPFVQQAICSFVTARRCRLSEIAGNIKVNHFMDWIEKTTAIDFS